MPIKNISLRVFKKYLEFKGLKHVKTEGGHEKWIKQGMLKPVIVETHIGLARRRNSGMLNSEG